MFVTSLNNLKDCLLTSTNDMRAKIIFAVSNLDTTEVKRIYDSAFVQCVCNGVLVCGTVERTNKRSLRQTVCSIAAEGFFEYTVLQQHGPNR